MNKGRLLSGFAFLMLASLAWGQAPVVQPEVPAVILQPGDCAAMPARAFDLAAPWVFTADADFLLWFIARERTAGIAGLRGPATLDIAGGPDDDSSSQSPLPGGRFAVGAWSPDIDPILGPEVPLYWWGAEVEGFFLNERSTAFAAQVSVPGLATSDLVGGATFDLWGVEANVHANIYRNPPSQIFRADLFAGVRHLHFNSALTATRRTTFAADLANFPAFLPLAGTLVEQTAAFSTETRFFGAQVGLGTQLILSRHVMVGSEFKLALGTNLNDSDIAGQVGSTPVNPAVGTGPFPAFSGSFSRNRFSYVPQVGLYLALPFGDHLTVRVGGDLFYWSQVARAANQVDLTTAAGASAGAEVIRNRGLLVTGVDVGLQFRY
jgi:hypothetical protein